MHQTRLYSNEHYQIKCIYIFCVKMMHYFLSRRQVSSSNLSWYYYGLLLDRCSTRLRCFSVKLKHSEIRMGKMGKGQWPAPNCPHTQTFPMSYLVSPKSSFQLIFSLSLTLLLSMSFWIHILIFVNFCQIQIDYEVASIVFIFFYFHLSSKFCGWSAVCEIDD